MLQPRVEKGPFAFLIAWGKSVSKNYRTQFFGKNTLKKYVHPQLKRVGADFLSNLPASKVRVHGALSCLPRTSTRTRTQQEAKYQRSARVACIVLGGLQPFRFRSTVVSV